MVNTNFTVQTLFCIIKGHRVCRYSENYIFWLLYIGSIPGFDSVVFRSLHLPALIRISIVFGNPLRITFFFFFIRRFHFLACHIWCLLGISDLVTVNSTFSLGNRNKKLNTSFHRLRSHRVCNPNPTTVLRDSVSGLIPKPCGVLKAKCWRNRTKLST